MTVRAHNKENTRFLLGMHQCQFRTVDWVPVNWGYPVRLGTQLTGVPVNWDTPVNWYPVGLGIPVNWHWCIPTPDEQKAVIRLLGTLVGFKQEEHKKVFDVI